MGGVDSPFELLVACIISIRTRGEATVVLARRLFELARTPEAMGRLSVERIDAAIGASTFHEGKAYTPSPSPARLRIWLRSSGDSRYPIWAS